MHPLLVAAALVAVAACAAPQPAVELTAVSEYGRHAAVVGMVDVRIANHGDDELAVQTWQIRHPMFEPVPAATRESTLPNDGQERIAPVPFGAAKCDVTQAAGATLAVGVRNGDGVREVEVPLADAEAGLVRAHRLACAEQRVTDAVGLDLVAPFALRLDGDRPALHTTLRADRRGSGEVAVSELRGTILYAVQAPSPLLTLPRDADQAEADVVVTAPRCDQHARIESKTSFTFPAFVSLDGGEPVRSLVTVSAPARAALERLLIASCGG